MACAQVKTECAGRRLMGEWHSVARGMCFKTYRLLEPLKPQIH